MSKNPKEVQGQIPGRRAIQAKRTTCAKTEAECVLCF